MLVTDSGIVIDVKEELPEKASTSMFVTDEGMKDAAHPRIKVLDSVLIRALQSSRLSYVTFPLSTLIDAKDEQ